MVESRTYDPMGRLLTMTTALPTGEGFAMEYQYDGVGSARRMDQTSWNLAGKARDAVILWEYDDRYRLTAETCTAGGSPASRTELHLNRTSQ